APRRLHQLVARRANGTGAITLGRVAAVPLEKQQTLGPLDRFTLQQSQQTAAVERYLFWLLDTAGLNERGSDVDMRRELVHLGTGRKPAWPAHQAGRANAAVVNRSLQVAQDSVIARLLRTIVGHEDHNGVGREVERFEPRQQASQVVVNVGDHAI